jgi:PKD repeat protein
MRRFFGGVGKLQRAALAVALLQVGCTVHNTDTPSLAGPSEASGVLSPLVQTPTARFSFAPAVPSANSPVVFDGRLSCVGLADPLATNPCPSTGGSITSFVWDFGDFTSATGPIATHTFDTQRTYNVTLTVMNDSNRSSSTTRPVPVGAGLLPAAAFVVSPTAPAVGQTVFVDASTSTPGGGHVIAGYTWNWGDGTGTSGVTSNHTYAAAGTYVVVLTVIDEEGQSASTTRNLSIGTGAPSASFSFAVTAPGTHTVTFDGSASTAAGGATVTNYSYLFGDGLSASGAAAIASHSYNNPGTYTVTLTVTDSLGRSGVTSQSITVP